MEDGGEEDLHLSPVDSDHHSDHHSDDPPHHSDQLPATVTPVLTDELRDKIIRQVEYYLSDENLRTDKFLLKYLVKDEQGYIPIGVIASFRKMKKLTTHKSLVVTALKESSLLTLSKNQKKVKRVHPFPLTEILDPELCTVLVENLPEDHTIDNMKKIFGEAGIIKKITIHEGNATREGKKCSTEEKLLSGKLHAVVEYQTVEAAENAAAMLNNEQDWRYGMRVKLLKRRIKNALMHIGKRDMILRREVACRQIHLGIKRVNNQVSTMMICRMKSMSYIPKSINQKRKMETGVKIGGVLGNRSIKDLVAQAMELPTILMGVKFRSHLLDQECRTVQEDSQWDADDLSAELLKPDLFRFYLLCIKYKLK